MRPTPRRRAAVRRLEDDVTIDLSRVKTIVFDVDGTLYRQSPLRRAMLGKLVCAAFMRPASAFAMFRALRAYRHAQEKLRGAVVDEALGAAQLRLACEACGQPESLVAPIVAQWIEEEPLPLLERFVDPALRRLLTESRARGLRLGVFSDYPAAAKLAAMRLAEYFDVVVTAQDPAVNRFKPDPSGLVETLRRLNADAAASLYVGDRHDVDATVARAAGVPCIIVGKSDPSAAEGCASVANYGQLYSILFSSKSELTP
jgi:FMN phosphatase YigB (HAD superfamily)